MAIQGKGFQYALNAFKTEAVKIRLYGEFTPPASSPQEGYSSFKNISWQNPADVSGTWQIETVTSNAIEITSGEISSFNGSFTVIGLEIYDSSNNVLLRKAFEGAGAPYTFTQRTVFNVESIIVSSSFADVITILI